MTYELTMLLSAEKKGEGLEAMVKKIEAIVKAVDGKVTKTTEMGKKQLAYRVKGLAEAMFVSFALDMPKAAVVQLGRKLTVDRDVVRHLLVAIEKK